MAGRSADPAHVRRLFRPAPRLSGRGMDERHRAAGRGEVGACHRHVGTGPRARRDALAAIGRRQARLSARHRLQRRPGRSRHRRRAQGAEAISQSARRAADAVLGQRPGAPGGKPRPDFATQFAGFPPRLRAAGKARSAFRIAGLCGAGGIRGRADQGVSQCAHDPGACRHADRAHARSRSTNGARRSPRWRRSPICM